MTDLKVGDRARIVLEGPITDLILGGLPLIGDGKYPNRIDPNADHVVSIEVLTPPEPEWQYGDVISDRDGKVFLYADTDPGEAPTSWVGVGKCCNFTSLEALTRPLTLLVRDGKPV